MKQKLLKLFSKQIAFGFLIITIIVVIGIMHLKGDYPISERKIIGHSSLGTKDVKVHSLDLKGPMGVAVKDNLLAINDSGKNRIIIKDTKSEKQTIISKAGDLGSLSYPIDVVFSSGDKLLYVTDMYKGKVFSFDTKGNLKKVFPRSQDKKKVGTINPVAVDLDKTGRLYITDVGRHRVVVFDSDGKFLFEFGKKGSRKGELQYPNGITVDDKEDRIYVSDTNNSRIQVYNKQGKFLRVLPMPKDIDLNTPRGIVITPDNKLYFVDTLANRVYCYDLTAKKISALTIKEGLRLPNDVAANGNELYIADRGSNRLISFSINHSEVKGIGQE